MEVLVCVAWPAFFFLGCQLTYKTHTRREPIRYYWPRETVPADMPEIVMASFDDSLRTNERARDQWLRLKRAGHKIAANGEVYRVAIEGMVMLSVDRGFDQYIGVSGDVWWWLKALIKHRGDGLSKAYAEIARHWPKSPSAATFSELLIWENGLDQMRLQCFTLYWQLEGMFGNEFKYPSGSSPPCIKSQRDEIARYTSMLDAHPALRNRNRKTKLVGHESWDALHREALHSTDRVYQHNVNPVTTAEQIPGLCLDLSVLGEYSADQLRLIVADQKKNPWSP